MQVSLFLFQEKGRDLDGWIGWTEAGELWIGWTDWLGLSRDLAGWSDWTEVLRGLGLAGLTGSGSPFLSSEGKGGTWLAGLAGLRLRSLRWTFKE
jgi:hypothetical protein